VIANNQILQLGDSTSTSEGVQLEILLVLAKQAHFLNMMLTYLQMGRHGL